MNVELYYIKDQILTQEEESEFIETLEEIINKKGANLLYKTIINPTLKNLELAFEETNKSPEKIDYIIVVGGLLNDESCLIKKYFSSYNISLTAGKLSDCARLVYYDEDYPSGYLISGFKGNNVFVLPNAQDRTALLISTYILPYLTKKDKYDVITDYDKDIRTFTVSKLWTIASTVVLVIIVCMLVFIWYFLNTYSI